MLASYVKRGVTAGLVAGLAFALLVALVANPLVAFADGFGGHHADGAHHGADGHDAGGAHHHESAVSTAVTNGVSVLSGVLWGVLLGGVVFGFAYYLLEPAIPGTGGTKSYLLAAAGFVTVSGAPWLALPPQPPGVEQVLSADTRLLVYGGMMVAGAVVCLLSGFAYDRLRGEYGRATATVAAALPFALLAIPAALAPANATQSALPPALATGLTGMVVLGQAALWTLLAGMHARLRRRSTDGRASEDATPRADATVGAD